MYISYIQWQSQMQKNRGVVGTIRLVLSNLQVSQCQQLESVLFTELQCALHQCKTVKAMTPDKIAPDLKRLTSAVLVELLYISIHTCYIGQYPLF